MNSDPDWQNQLKELEKDLTLHLAARIGSDENIPAKPSSKAQDLAHRLAPSVKELWNLFNSKRPKNLPPYMDEAEIRLSYLASFFIPNILRTAHLVERYAMPLIQALAHPKAGQRDTFCLLDIGAGPLSASLSFCMVLDRVSGKSGRGTRRIQVEILAVERSSDIFDDGLALGYRVFESLQQKGFDITVTRISLRQLFKQEPIASLILATNVLNELKISDREKLADLLARPEQQSGLVLFMEPGQDRHAQNLASFRDRVLSSARGYKVLGPCPHQMPCPLGPNSGRKDWCWFRLQDTITPWMKTLDRATGLRHEELSYSYFCISKLKSSMPALWGTVVSDDIDLSRAPEATRNRLFIHLRNQAVKAARGHEARMPLLKEDVTKGPLHKTLICHESGRLQGLFFKSHSPLQRGEGLLNQPRHGYLALERLSQNKSAEDESAQDRKKPVKSKIILKPEEYRSHKRTKKPPIRRKNQ